MQRKNICESFPFVATARAQVLILGSTPGVKSLSEQQYYAHPHNIFWDIMGEVCGAGRQLPYAQRLAQLKKCRIALWDVIGRCERTGSLDAAIHRQSVRPNDFVSLFEQCPKIHTVFLNGHTADQCFRQWVLSDLSPLLASRKHAVALIRLPSTSPAHASLSKQQKIAEWRQALALALQ